MHTVLYLVRRLVYAVSIVYFGPAAQYHVYVASSALLLAFQFRVFPMDDRTSQYMEIFNESTILLVGALLAPFFAESAQGDPKQIVGWAMAGLTLANVAVNELMMIF